MKIICESHLKERITFEYAFPFFLESTDGLYEMEGDVTSMKSAFGVGETYLDTSISKRNIIIKGAIKKSDLASKRQTLYRCFPLKSTGTLYYYDGDIARKINYKVESVKITIDKKIYKHFQISLICPYPYFTDINKTTMQMATWSPAFKFALKIPINEGIKFGTKNITSMAVIKNNTNLEFGMTITFSANANVVNPSLFNVDTREEMKVEKELNTGDKIVINTYRQNKNIILKKSDGTEENINNSMVYGSKFLQIHCGENTFRYNADSGVSNLEATIEYLTEYEAV